MTHQQTHWLLDEKKYWLNVLEQELETLHFQSLLRRGDKTYPHEGIDTIEGV